MCTCLRSVTPPRRSKRSSRLTRSTSLAVGGSAPVGPRRFQAFRQYSLLRQGYYLPNAICTRFDSYVAQKTVSHTSFVFDSGNSRTRLPVAANTALHNAGANGGTPGSPTPAGGASLSTMCTSTLRGARSTRVSW